MAVCCRVSRWWLSWSSTIPKALFMHCTQLHTNRPGSRLSSPSIKIDGKVKPVASCHLFFCRAGAYGERSWNWIENWQLIISFNLCFVIFCVCFVRNRGIAIEFNGFLYVSDYLLGQLKRRRSHDQHLHSIWLENKIYFSLSFSLSLGSGATLLCIRCTFSI